MKLKFIILIILSIILFINLSNKCKDIENFEINVDKKVTQKIPKVIWTYWESENLPEFIQGCIATWRKYNPDYKINILNKVNVHEYLSNINVYNLKMADSQQRISDFIRLNILATNGGFWLDASIILNQSLDWIINYNVDVMCYHIDQIKEKDSIYPVIESWFFATVPNSDFVIKWRDEFMSINNFNTPDDYLQDVKNRGANLNSPWCNTYLLIHVAALAVLQLTKTSSNIKILDARSTTFNHLRFNSSPVEIEESLYNICNDEPKQPVIKIRGIDRDFMKEKRIDCLLNLLEI